MDNQYIVVMVTTSSKQEAENIARNLLEAKLIACANILGPISSHFHWQGMVDHSEEFLVLMKSRLDLFEAISAQVKTLHSYEVPEILALPVVKGSSTYLNWLGSALR